MNQFFKRCAVTLSSMVAIVWFLPQSLFYDCVRPLNVENEIYSVEEYQKIFDISGDEFEIVFGLREVMKGFK